MTDHNRGAYTPQSDAPLAFDARRTGGPGARPFPITLVVSAIILLVLVAGAFYLYSDGVRGKNEPPQPVGEPVAEMKAPAPVEPQPSEVTNGLQVYSDGGSGAEPKLAPPPEAPLARPVAPVEAQPLPAPAAAAPAAPVISAPVAATPKTGPGSAPKTAAAPAAAPKTAPTKVATAPAAAVAAQAPAAPAPKAATASAQVQIGAYSSSTLADDGWSRLARSQPGQMAGKTKRIEEVQVDGRTLYRALVGGFATRADAVEFCTALQARGDSCTVR